MSLKTARICVVILIVPIAVLLALGLFDPRLRLLALIPLAPLAVVCVGFLRCPACGKNVGFTDRHCKSCGEKLR